MKTRIRVTQDADLAECLSALRRAGIDKNEALSEGLRKLAKRKRIKIVSEVGAQ